MSKIVLYIPLERYLSEWATSHLGDPIVFPAKSNENAIIRTFLKERPDGVPIELNPNGTLTAIAIPDSKSKPPEKYNYMTARGKDAVREMIKDLFKRQLWNDLNPIIHSNVGVNTLISAWCEMNGISLDRVETVRQCYYRMRDAYAKRGIILRSTTKKSSDDNP